MKSLSPSTSSRTIVAILVVAALAIAFWSLLLSPEREKADALSKTNEAQQATLAQAQSEVAAGEAARREFGENYQQLVVLGKAVPATDESASLLVQLNAIAKRSKVTFDSLQQGTASESESSGEAEAEPETAPAAGEAAPEEAATATVPPTEAAIALSPLGVSVGPAGLSILPYNLTFSGSFFHVADFIDGIDSMIETRGSRLGVDGRLVTLDGFSLVPDTDAGFPTLKASFAVTTYLVPPGEGITGSAAPVSPEGAVGLATSTTTELE